ncbi:MAG: hypothetical protein LC723_01130 [Actinobacteria bacterium]|nr:hypothetical protein [Actinomycetota bacterium]
MIASFPAVGPIYSDPAGRILYQIAFSSPETDIEIRSLETLAVLRTAVVNPNIASVPTGVGNHQPGGLAEVDPVGHRLFYPFRDQATNALMLATIDAKTAQVTVSPLAAPQSADLAFGIEALSYRASTHTLYVLWSAPVGVPASAAARTGPIFISAVDVTNADISTLWFKQIDLCNSLFTDTFVSEPFGYSDGNIYLGCFSGSTAAGTAEVVKVRMNSDQTIMSMSAFASPAKPTEGAFDPIAKRMYLLNSGIMAVFDGEREVWVGLLVPGSRATMGINPAIGRVYLCGSSGFFSTDAGAGTPVPPGTDFSGLQCKTGDPTFPIVSDPSTGHVFVEGGDGGSAWQMIADPIPAYEAPPVFDPDQGAEDVTEQPGLTESSFSSQGAAYGTRVIWVAGPMGNIDNSTLFVGQVTRGDQFRNSPNDVPPGLGVRFGEGSREIRFARVAGAKMSDSGVEAGAIAVDRDTRLDNDLENLRQHPFNQTAEDPSNRKPQWPYTGALCLGYGGKTDVPVSHGSSTMPVDGGSSAVASCDFSRLGIDASAHADQYGVSGIVKIGESTAHVVTLRDPALGAYTQSTAISKNINIADQVFIAQAAATATAWAKGRPGKAGTDGRQFSFSGVRVFAANGTLSYSCNTVSQCDPANVVGAINRVFGPRIVARIPDPDPTFKDGTPMGTTASLEQNHWEQVQEQVLFDKPVEDLTVPALELRIGTNLLATSGYIVQLAGVTASSGYRTFRIPQGSGFGDLGASFGPIGGFTSDGVLPPPPDVSTHSKKVKRSLVQKIRTGMRLVFGVGHDARSVMASWLLLLSPIYVFVRRRSFLRRTVAG